MPPRFFHVEHSSNRRCGVDDDEMRQIRERWPCAWSAPRGTATRAKQSASRSSAKTRERQSRTVPTRLVWPRPFQVGHSTKGSGERSWAKDPCGARLGPPRCSRGLRHETLGRAPRGGRNQVRRLSTRLPGAAWIVPRGTRGQDRSLDARVSKGRYAAGRFGSCRDVVRVKCSTWNTPCRTPSAKARTRAQARALPSVLVPPRSSRSEDSSKGRRRTAGVDKSRRGGRATQPTSIGRPGGCRGLHSEHSFEPLTKARGEAREDSRHGSRPPRLFHAEQRARAQGKRPRYGNRSGAVDLSCSETWPRSPPSKVFHVEQSWNNRRVR